MASLLSLGDVVKAAGEPVLLYARINWRKLQGKSKAPLSDPDPYTARSTYTREARRTQRQRQLERRGGLAGLARAIRAIA